MPFDICIELDKLAEEAMLEERARLRSFNELDYMQRKYPWLTQKDYRYTRKERVLKPKKRTSQNKRRRPDTTSRNIILLLQRSKCFYCGIKFGEFYMYGERLICVTPHWDHVLPFSYCDSSKKGNFVASCQLCNSIKSSKVFSTVKEAIEFVRARRKKKGLPLATPPLRTPFRYTILPL